MTFQRNTQEIKFNNTVVINGLIIERASKLLMAFLVAFLCIPLLYGQSKKSLEKKRKQLIVEIEQTTKELKKIKADKAFALREFVVLQEQVDQRKALLENTERSVSLLDYQIDSTTQSLDTLQSGLDILQGEYKQLINHAYRLKLSDGWMSFLFSADSFNNALLRWRYIKQFERTRKRQIELLQDKLTEMEIRKLDLERNKSEKKFLLETVREQNQLLNSELSKQDHLVKELSAEEKKQAKALVSKRQAQLKIQQTIESIIERELSKRTAANTNSASSRSTSSIVSKVGKAFLSHKSRLNWPVRNGLIVERFGRQEHPELKLVQTNNNGIDIKTDFGAEVFSVYEGKVTGVQYIPGLSFTVILQHGEFYTVYSNLSNVTVELNNQVTVGQKLGNIVVKNNIFHFELWEQRKKLNPEIWLSKK